MTRAALGKAMVVAETSLWTMTWSITHWFALPLNQKFYPPILLAMTQSLVIQHLLNLSLILLLHNRRGTSGCQPCWDP